MPKARAKGERVTISAPLVPILRQITERKLFGDLSEAVNWVVRAYLEEHPELLNQKPVPSPSSNTQAPTDSPSDDINSILKDLS